MNTHATTLDKLQILESLYRQGYQSDVIDRALDKIIALERAQTQGEMEELQARLESFEHDYHMSSADFSRRFHAGELGDAADFFEWSAFYDMVQALRRRLQEFEIEAG